jgi:glutathionyl-hydroquinone reductase
VRATQDDDIALRSIAHSLISSFSSTAEFTLEKDRYRLYVAAPCVFAHRVRMLISLQNDIHGAFAMTWMDDKNQEKGWFWKKPEPEFGVMSLPEVYAQASPDYHGSHSTPLIVDRRTKTMVSNESLDVCVALAQQHAPTLLPDGAEALAKEVGTITMLPYLYLIKGKPMELAQQFWRELDQYEKRLAQNPYLMGDTLTLPDCILWITMIQMDNIYTRQFGLPEKTIQGDYPNLRDFVERIWNLPSSSGSTVGEDANLPEIIRMSWNSEAMAPLAGNDPTSEPPPMISLF